MQAIVSLVNSGADFDAFENKSLHGTFVFLEGQFPGKIRDIERWTTTSPHLLKTHLHADFFEKTLNESKTKFIVVFRNPKDTLVSYYHFYRMNSSFIFDGDWNDFFQMFKEKKLHCGDYFQTTLSWWKWKDDPRVLIINYEDMVESPEDAVRKVMKFMGKSLPDEAVSKIVEKTSFNALKENPRANYKDVPFFKQEISPFFRKGQVGDWRNQLTDEQSEYIDQLITKHFDPVGLSITE